MNIIEACQMYTNRAFEYIEKNDWDRAITNLEAALRIAPNDGNLKNMLNNMLRNSLIGRGARHAKEGNNAQAIENFEAILRTNPNDADAKKYIRTLNDEVSALEWVKAQIRILGIKANGFTLMDMAMASARIDVMKLLLAMDNGLAIDKKDANGDMLIHIAAGCGYTEAVKWLLDNGAKANARGQSNRTPMHQAAANGKVDVMRYLKEHGANLYARDDNDLSPMDSAVTCEQTESIKCLVQLGADINARDNDGATPIFSAAQAGHIDSIKCLVQLGADVNARDNNGATPLFLAAFMGQFECLKCLVQLGADVEAKAKNGMTPKDAANVDGHSEIVEWLRANEAKVLHNNGYANAVFDGKIIFLLLAGILVAACLFFFSMADKKTTTKTFLPLASVNIDMLFVKGGTFTMGCTQEQGKDCSNGEKSTHSVTVSDFQIGKYEVTQNQWVQVIGNNPSAFKGDDLPVENVSWNDVQEFISKLNSMTGKNYRLPTEAEWEYAARGGAENKGYKYAGSNNIDEISWYKDNSGNRTHPVGTKQPNELGIYDMSGNVWEWVNNANSQDPLSDSVVERGGSWNRPANRSQVSYKSKDSPNHHCNTDGFRLAMSVQNTNSVTF